MPELPEVETVVRQLNQVVIGKKLAQILNVKLGGTLVLLAQAYDGSLASDIFTIKGILKTASPETVKVPLYIFLSSVS